MYATSKQIRIRALLMACLLALGASSSPIRASEIAPDASPLVWLPTDIETAPPVSRTGLVLPGTEPSAPVGKPGLPDLAATSAATATLRINQGTYPSTMDPQMASFQNDIAHVQMIYEGLTRFDTSLEAVPGAAESWEYSADAKTLTFTLRANLKYSDGSVLNAKRFEYAILRNIDPATASEYGFITDEIVNAPEWRATDPNAPGYDRNAWVASVGVKALDASGLACVNYAQTNCRSLRLTLSRPAAYFHKVMALHVTYPAKQENIAAGGANWWVTPTYQTGNGPWVLSALEPSVRSYLEPNANYWAGLAQVNIENRYIVDSAAALLAYQDNQLDVTYLSTTDISAVDGNPALQPQHLSFAGSCTTAFRFSLTAVFTSGNLVYASPFADPKVRESFALAFDASRFVSDTASGLATWTWIPPGHLGYDPSTPLHYDPIAARAALSASTYGGPAALNALDLRLKYGFTTRNQTRYEWLVTHYSSTIGVRITLEPISTVSYSLITKSAATFPLISSQGWCEDYPDPQNWLSVYWRSSSVYAQRSGYGNPAFDALVDQADAEPNQTTRITLYKQAQQLMLNDYPAAFGYNSISHFLVKPWVKGIVTTPQDAWPGSHTPLTVRIEPLPPRAYLPIVVAPPTLSFWQAANSPSAPIWQAVDMQSDSEGWAVGDGGAIMRRTGGNWSTFASPITHSLNAVKMLGANDGWAVGDSGAIYRWTGSAWQPFSSPTNLTLRGLSVISSTLAWAVGGDSPSRVILRWNGASWITQTLPAQNGSILIAIHMLSPTDGWAGGNFGSMLHWNGSSWQTVSVPTSLYVNAISMVSATDGWAVGGVVPNGLVLRWNGATWSTFSVPASNELKAIHMVSANDGWAFSYYGREALHWNGISWSKTGTPISVNGVDMTDVGSGWAVGGGGVIHYAPCTGLWVTVLGQDGLPASGATIRSRNVANPYNYYPSSTANTDGVACLNLSPAGAYDLQAFRSTNAFAVYARGINSVGSATLSAAGLPVHTVTANSLSGQALSGAWVSLARVPAIPTLGVVSLGNANASGIYTFSASPDSYDIGVTDLERGYNLASPSEALSATGRVFNFDASTLDTGEIILSHPTAPAYYQSLCGSTLCSYSYSGITRVVVNTGRFFYAYQETYLAGPGGIYWDYGLYPPSPISVTAANRVVTHTVGGPIAFRGRTENASPGSTITLTTAPVDAFGNLLNIIFTGTSPTAMNTMVYHRAVLTDSLGSQQTFSVPQPLYPFAGLSAGAPLGIYRARLELQTGPYSGTLSASGTFTVVASLQAPAAAPMASADPEVPLELMVKADRNNCVKPLVDLVPMPRELDRWNRNPEWPPLTVPFVRECDPER